MLFRSLVEYRVANQLVSVSFEQFYPPSCNQWGHCSNGKEGQFHSLIRCSEIKGKTIDHDKMDPACVWIILCTCVYFCLCVCVCVCVSNLS